MRLACLSRALSFDILLSRGAAYHRHDFSAPGSNHGHPVAFSVTFVLQINLWHLGVSPPASPPGADSVSDCGFYGGLPTIAMPLRGQIFALPSCSPTIAKDPLSLNLA